MKRSFRVVVLAVLTLLLIGPVPNSLARPPGPRLPAGRNVATPKAIEVPAGVAAAYGTGTIVHADVLRTGQHALVDVDVAFSGAAMSSGEAPDKYTNEVHRLVGPKLAKFGLDKTSYGRGAGLEVGIGSDPRPLIGQLAEAAAPESTNLIHKVVGPIAVPGILRAELLRGQAQALARTGGCPLGKDGAYGLGSVLNLELLGGLVATNARPPYREVAQSNSTTRIVRRDDGRLGLKSETRQTILPVTLFKGTPLQFTVEVLGEWALRAIAYGDESSLHYGPRNVSPQTPVVRILDAKGGPIAQITTQMLLGKKGLEITIPEVAEIVVGEDPRMIGDNATSDPLTETKQVAAAADVVRVKLLKGQLADVRIGHMEAAITVPSDGLNKLCPGLIVDQTVDKPKVTTDEEFTYIITITNPNECVVTGLKVVEAPTAPAGVKFELVSTTPTGGSVAAGVVTYPDIGPLGPGETKTIKVKSKVPLGSAEGILKALAVATGVCPAEVQPPNDTDGPETPGSPETSDIPVRGEDSVDGPTVDICVVPLLDGKTPAEAKALLEAAGCTLGQVKDGGPGNPADLGKVVDQGPPAGQEVPLRTPVDITIGGPLCTVPSVAGKTPEEAKPILEAAGCDLGKVTTGPIGDPDDAGKITTQTPPAGDKVPTGTDVDVVVSPPACSVPSVIGKTEEEAKAILEKAGCRLGDVKPGADNPSQAGKITEQGTNPGTLVPAGTDVDVNVAGPLCTVPGLIGMTESEARSKVEAQGCVLVTQQKVTSNPSEIGKVTTQSPAADTHVAKGSEVKVTLGVQVLGETITRSQTEAADAGAGVAPDLARTGGVALGAAGLSLWMLLVGFATRVAGSKRLRRRTQDEDGIA